MIAKTLGNFEITSQLGKGRMGEVYQAKDVYFGNTNSLMSTIEKATCAFIGDIERFLSKHHAVS